MIDKITESQKFYEGQWSNNHEVKEFLFQNDIDDAETESLCFVAGHIMWKAAQTLQWHPASDLPMQPDASIVFESRTYLVTDGQRVEICDFSRGSQRVKPWAEWSDYSSLHPGQIKFWAELPKPPAM